MFDALTAPDLAGVLVDSRYRVKQRLGAGGMGVVWRAHQESLGRDVALKTLISDEPELVERFQREGRALSAIRHAHVCVVFDSGRFVLDGTAIQYIAMELIEGDTLRKRLARGPLSVDDGVMALLQILNGLAAAHAAGVVHRDIKPENVMFDRGALKLVDFGIARSVASDAKLTQTGGFVGTAGYTAPEVALGKSSGDAASDLYAVGAVAFEIFSGAPVFAAESGLALAMMHVSAEPPRLSTRATVPKAIDDLVAGLLAKDPAARPTVRQALDALAAVPKDAAPPPKIATRPATPRHSTTSLPPSAPTETSEPTVRPPVYSNPWFDIDVDHAQLLVRVVRNTKKLALADIDAAMSPLLKEPAVDRSRYAVLIDMRAAPPNNADDFLKKFDPLIHELVLSYPRRAVLVRSAVGALQVARSARALPGEHEMPIFNDEAAALASLSSTAPKIDTGRRRR